MTIILFTLMVFLGTQLTGYISKENVNIQSKSVGYCEFLCIATVAMMRQLL